MKRIFIILISLVILFIATVIVACMPEKETGDVPNGEYKGNADVDSGADVKGASVGAIESADYTDSYIESLTDIPADATTIVLSDAGSTVSGAGAEATEYGVIITEVGTYVLTGKLSGGQVLMQSDGQSRLILNGVEINCNDSAAIAIYGKEKKVITLAEGTTNRLSDGTAYADDSANGCLYAEKSLIINGEGSLAVTGNANNGISATNELKILSGSVNVTAKNNALKGNDAVLIKGGTISLNAEGDGIKSDNAETEDENIGYVYLYADRSTPTVIGQKIN